MTYHSERFCIYKYPAIFVATLFPVYMYVFWQYNSLQRCCEILVFKGYTESV